MTALSERDVLSALRQVTDPERGGDLVGLGMISGLAVKDGHVLFAIEVAPERGAKAEPLRLAAERAVERLPGVLSVSAMLTAHRAPPSAAPRAEPAKTAAKALVPGVHAIVAVASGTCCAMVSCASPVPGGMSTTRTSSSPQSTSRSICCSALITIGPRQIIGVSSAIMKPIDMHLTP